MCGSPFRNTDVPGVEDVESIIICDAFVEAQPGMRIKKTDKH
jgi:hypothetical protein